MQCPKDKKFNLVSDTLSDSLPVQRCPDCKGVWIPALEYKSWQTQQPAPPADPDALPQALDVEFVQPKFDTKAALCPECGHYLSRARVSFVAPFYVERCLHCEGIWCDYGEWDVLEKLGLHTAIERLFSSEWQAKVREKEQTLLERQATIEKLGEDLAQRVFDLAESLKKHPNGDFGVAYLMRRFESWGVGEMQPRRTIPLLDPPQKVT